MVTAFLIATLIFFILNLASNLLLVAIDSSRGVIPLVSIVFVLISLGMLTWNIFALVTN